MSEAKEELPAPSLGRAMLNLLPLILVTWYLCNNSPSSRPSYKLETCGSNLHTMGVEIEKSRLMSEDKLYSKTLEDVYGKKALPECPEGGSEAYVEGFKVSEDRSSYTLVCKGDHHKDAEVPSDYPRIAFSVQEAEAAGGDSGEAKEVKLEVAPEATSTPEVESTPEAESTPEESESQDKAEQGETEEGQVSKPEAEEPEAESTPAGSPTPKSD